MPRTSVGYGRAGRGAPRRARTILSIPILAGFVDVFQIVVGVVASLCGLGVLLMGAIALADRRWKPGGIALGAGLVLLLGGFWLVGVL